MKKVILLGTLFILTNFGLNGCVLGEEKDKPLVVTTLFPHYDFVKQIAGDLVDLKFLIGPGVNAHAYDPSAGDVITIFDSDLFIYTGEIMEPWIEESIVPNAPEGFNALDLSKSVTLLATDHDHVEEEEEHEGDFDPHFWTLPSNAKAMVSAISIALISILPEYESALQQATSVYLAQLDELDEAWSDLVAHADQLTIINAGHFAFGYVSEHYGFEAVSPYEGYTPNAEPTQNNIIYLIDLMNTLGIKTVYYEELIDPKVAQSIAEPTGANLVILNAGGNISLDQFNQGVTFLDVMFQNIENLKVGMAYHAN